MRISDWSSDVFSSDLARAAALLALEGLDLALDQPEALVARVGRAVDAGDRADDGAVARVDLLQRVGNLAHRGAHAARLHGEVEQVAAAVRRREGERQIGRAHV